TTPGTIVVPELKIERAGARADGTDNAANGVGDVVVGAGRMVDAIPAAPRGAALEGRQLAGELRMVDQVDQLRIHQRKQVEIQIALRLRCRLISDAMFAELLHRPFAAVAVALDTVDAIVLEQPGKFADRGFGRERRPDLPDGVNHRYVAVAVGDGQRHAIRASA